MCQKDTLFDRRRFQDLWIWQASQTCIVGRYNIDPRIKPPKAMNDSKIEVGVADEAKVHRERTLLALTNLL